jgi:DNA-binding transcriptional regulator YhcF (GntR family)
MSRYIDHNFVRLDASIGVPIHVQLEEQLKRLITTGYFEEGSKLPSNRELAGYLRVNRNTVARVMARLEDEGYAESRRGLGRFVRKPEVDAREAEKERFVEEVALSAAARGVPTDELARALLARAAESPPIPVPIVFVECNPFQVDRFGAELEERLPVRVTGLLVSELRDLVERREELPSRWVVTTFFHVHEVEELVRYREVETVGLLAVATLENLRRLKDLPPGTVVAVLGDVREGVYNLLRSIQGAGLGHLDLVAAYGDAEEMRELLERAGAVVCSSKVAEALPELGARPDLKVIVEDRTLDRGGIEMLGRMLTRPAEGRAEG